MRILFLVPFTNLAKQNAESVHVRELAQNLAALGHEVALVSCACGSNAEDARVRVKGVRQEFVHCAFNACGAFRVFSCAAAGFLKGASLLKKNDFDVVYERHYPLGVGVTLARLFRTRCVSEVNGFWSDEARLSKSVLKRFLSRFSRFEFVVSRNADKLVAVTPQIAFELEREWKIAREKIRVIENGVNTEVFRPCRAGKQSRIPTVCFVGSLAPWQGVEELIRAAPLVVNKIPSARFLVVGDGPLRRQLEELAQSEGVARNIIFTGSKPYEQIPRLIAGANVCVALKRPLKSGYSPLKLYEYFACAKPVVATRTAGFEIVERKRLGFLVNPQNAREVADAILSLLSNSRNAQEMGAKARKFVVKEHSWRCVARKVAAVCMEAVSA
ncbi:MAG: glycosyltransferase family 4 protein [Candidatus Norongarragalinales archaeon]